MTGTTSIALGIALFVSSTGLAQRVQPAAGVALYDADGKRVGPVIGTDLGFIYFVIRVDGVTVPLKTGSDSADAKPTGSADRLGLFFESTDCSGTPWFRIDPAPPRPSPVFRDTIVETETPGSGSSEDATVVWIASSQEPRFVTVRSQSTLDAERCRSPYPYGHHFVGVPARRLVDLDDVLRIPLEARAEPAIDLPALERRVRALERENVRLRNQLKR